MMLGILFVLIGCSEEPESIVVGWSGPLSGDYAIIGVENLRGVQLALDEINDSRIKLVIEDDQFDETKTLTAYQKLVQFNNIKSFLTVTYGGVLALGNRAEPDSVIIVDSLDTSEEIANAGEGVFGIGIYDEGIGYSLAEFSAVNLNSKKAGILYNDVDPFPLLVVTAFQQKYEANVGSKARFEKYSPEDKDFRTPLLKLKDADALVIIGFDEAGLAVRQARELGINAPILGIDTSTSEGFKKNAGFAYEGLYFTSWTPVDKVGEASFVSKYKSKFGKEPNQLLFAATGYDSMMIIADALQETDNYDVLKQKMYGIMNYKGLTGEITMSPDGISRTVREEMHQIRNGTVVLV